jgi:hypothetical protein
MFAAEDGVDIELCFHSLIRKSQNTEIEPSLNGSS